MTMSGERIPCINPRCRRTAPADKYDPGAEIICGKCFRALPAELRERYRRCNRNSARLLRLVERRIAKGTIDQPTVTRLRDNTYRRAEGARAEIKRRFTEPATPAGLENFLHEVGLDGQSK